ncbi:Rrf2 family transcriptional regulator [Saccharopolyspora sp. NFXS83]|uniref:Rrf2 family transcriptional regulator n=1 Tax=Saccharopolyspora sp. NFXS83 TaxID=2993560 RepID=UPI00224A6128|nr:Rrf2 family transcriptional regulator [Saccharopolyspora sp. NFXS83]MCX2731539.1 Rrf2 family transcriptional regulator [Saccharopolyspora sp. NFXS83]
MTMAVHILTWMAFDRRGTDKEIATSQRIATSVNTNPVVIRRCLTELKAAGLVEAQRGRSGGWILARDATEITLLDVYRALGEEPIFGMYTTPPDAECYVGHGIEATLTGIYAEANQAMTRVLEAKTIRDVLRESLADFPELWESQGFAPARF